MFDEEPDGDPHGECAAEIHRLRAEVERLRGALGGIRDRDFKLSDAKRRAQRALLATEALQEPTR